MKRGERVAREIATWLVESKSLQLGAMVNAGGFDRAGVEAAARELFEGVLRKAFGDCACNADEDEPIFVLRAHDCKAPDTVCYWADEVAHEANPVLAVRAGIATSSLPPKAVAAYEIVKTMLAWQEKNGSKVPD